MNFKFYTIVFAISFLTYFSQTSFAQIPQDGLVGHYMLDGNAADSSGLVNHGTIVDQVIPTTNRFGEIDKACSFEGGYIDAGNPMDFQINDGITLAAWINPTVIDNWSGIITKWSQEFGGVYFGVNPNGQVIRWNIDGTESTEGDSLIIGEWIHVAATFDGDSIKTYQDGILSSSTYNDTPIADNQQNLIIGSQSNNLTAIFTGAIDDVVIYNRGLNQAGIDSLFNPPVVLSDTRAILLTRSVDVFPNPTSDILNIKNNTDHNILSYILYNTNGMKIEEGTFQEKVDVSNQPKGIYHLRMYFEDGFLSKKFIKGTSINL